jgi:cation-transporting ATPase I
MRLLRPLEAARAAAGVAARVTLTSATVAVAPAVVTAGLLAEPTRAAARLARAATGTTAAAASGSLRLARTAAETGTQAVGTLLTGANPIPDGHVRSVARTARGLFEPPEARHTRRIYADRQHVQVEVAAPAAGDQPEVRRAVRRQLERLEGVQWATVNDVVGRVLVGIDSRRVSAEGSSAS